MSTTLKIGYLRALERMGRKSLKAKSVFNFPYRISLGDMFSENPYYNPVSNVGEILATAAWVLDKQSPIIFDIGGHCGFIASQLAQLLRKNNPSVFSFEPVAPTFTDLLLSINELSLQKYIHPIAVALSDEVGFVKLNYSKRNSMLAQIIPEGVLSNERAGSETYIAPSQTLDGFIKSSNHPDVIKMDVEGWEVHVLKGATNLWSTAIHQNTGICLEWNPDALRDTGTSVNELYSFFSGYKLYYINDYEGQRFPELTLVSNPLELSHVCNLFAIHNSCSQVTKWKENYEKLKTRYNVRVG